jgi:ABC-type Fe3+-siderophore transport system permease subunit
MDLTTVYWTICITLGVATCTMAAGLVAFVATIIGQIQRISGRHARN